MGLKELFSGLFGKSNSATLKELCFDLGVEYYYKNLAIESCVNLIANTLVRSQFRTFEKGKEVKRNNYYLFNVQPNQNQNSSEFFHEFVSKLVLDNECLVIMQDQQLYVADEFTVENFAFKENIYKDIVVNDFQLNKTFIESDVFYFKLNNKKIKNAVDSLYASYGKLLTASMNYYKRSNALRVKYQIDALVSQSDEEQQALEDMFNAQLARFLKAEDAAALPEQDGLNIGEMFQNSKGSTSRDTRAIVDDIFDFISMAFHVPKGLLKGDLADVEGQTDNFIMFCVAPIAELIEDEINRKFYTKQEFLDRTYFKVDTSFIKYVDPIKLATALDKMLSSGTHSVNENRNMIGKEPLDEEWADEHYVTKNYEGIKEYLKGGEGE
ncbi:phage portal protein [Virgibacillus sp. Bac332]|uniref:phage portal protein n=1 Tax=Virgibacillus sp. Bac332 TaxID=2419842 RepID=UPI000EF54F57|nr:phage portal protein [Virgibacillus sp. Bac332]